MLLADMDQVMPWTCLLVVVELFYPKAGCVRKPYLNGNYVSDPAMENALYEITLMRQFARLTLSAKDYGLPKTYCSEALVMDRDKSPYFNVFLKFYKVFFGAMLLFALGATVDCALKSNYRDAFEGLCGAIILAALLWCGYNVDRLEARLKAKS